MLFEDDLTEAETIASVLVPVAVPGAYTYKVPAGEHAEPGTIVRVPLGSRQVLGAVWEGEPQAGIDPRKLKSIQEVFPVRPLDDDLRHFVDWVANWTLAPPGMVLRMVLRSEEALYPEAPVSGVRRVAQAEPERMTTARQRVLKVLSPDGPAFTKSALATEAGVSASVVDGLIRQGVLEVVSMPASRSFPVPDPDHNPPTLTPAQAEVAGGLRSTFDKGYEVSLIDGVTGSGKTEVYFEAIA